MDFFFHFSFFFSRSTTSSKKEKELNLSSLPNSKNSGGNVTLADGIVRRNRSGFFGGGSLLMFTSLGAQNVLFDSNA